MAKTIQNMDRLIQMPYGCGEQNMVNFVPNILVLQYFDATGQGEEDDRARALSYMTRGNFSLLIRSFPGSIVVHISLSSVLFLKSRRY